MENQPLDVIVERLRAACDAGNIGIHDFDVVADSVYWDERVRALWGVDADTPVNYALFASGVHPDDLPGVEAELAKAFDPEGAGEYLAEYRVINRRDGTTRLISATGKTTFGDSKPVRLVGTVRDVTDVRMQQDARQAAESLSQSLIAAAPTIIYVYSLVERRNLFITPQAAAMMGLSSDAMPDDDGALMRSIMHPDDLERVVEHHQMIAESRSDGPFSIEYRMRHRDGEWHWYVSQDVVHVRGPDGEPQEILGAALDITDRFQWEEQREFLLQELNHRVKNAVAVTQAVASITLKRHCDPKHWKVFEERILAMARAQNELVRGGWERIDLRELASQTLAPYLNANGRVLLDGAPVKLPGREAMNVAMALHELSTNAAKYGALSTEKGQVHISWTSEVDSIRLCWAEVGGPPVTQPVTKGFGLDVINLADINRRADISFEKSGLRVTLILPRGGGGTRHAVADEAIAGLGAQ